MSRSARVLEPEVFEQPQALTPRRVTAISVDGMTPYGGDFSPAKAMQAHLVESLVDYHGAKWSARKLLAFILMTCGGFWALVVLLVRTML